MYIIWNKYIIERKYKYTPICMCLSNISVCVCIFSGSPKILRSCASPDSQAEPRAWTANPQAMPWDQVCPAAWAKAPRMEPHSYPPPKKKKRSVACQKPFIFDEIRLIARILTMIPMITVRSLKKLPGSYPSCYPSWQFDCWKSGPMQCPVAGKDHWCGTRWSYWRRVEETK